MRRSTCASTARRRPTSDDPTGSRGQVVRLLGERAGTLDGIGRWSYDGRALPVVAVRAARGPRSPPATSTGATTRTSCSRRSPRRPASFRKTLRGKLVEHDGALPCRLGPDTLPVDLRDGLTDGSIDRVIAIGQGTAAVAGAGLVRTLDAATAGTGLRVEAELATELSGFGLRTDMSDTLVVAVSQSGTTTDTNRTVDLVRARGATVVSIVNRRASDLTDKSDGVLYTSDGRDVEMSVASTKAFYSQVAAGFLLAYAIADLVAPDPRSRAERGRTLAALRDLPDAMEETLTHAGRPSPRPPTSSPRRSATGRWSAPGPTASPRWSCGSSSRSSATRPSPATPPRTRSTSTCPPSRSSSCAPPASRGRTPTTWPRRWRSTGPTRPRRSSSPPRATSASARRCRR